MGYRDDLGAAQARADAASRALEDEKAARGDDAARIAELERSLAASLKELADLREGGTKLESAPLSRKSEPKAVAIVFACGMLLLVGGGVGYFSMSRSAPTNSFDDEIFAPADPRFDVSEQLSVARRAATRYFHGEFLSGPFLLGIEAKAVDESGRSQLEFGRVEYRFSVELESMELREDHGPVGTRAKQVDRRNCHVSITVDTEGIKYPSKFSAEIDGFLAFGKCAGPGLDPRCTVAEIRRRSLDDGAPKGALATVTFTGRPTWHVGIVDQGKELFSKTYSDDCPR